MKKAFAWLTGVAVAIAAIVLFYYFLQKVVPVVQNSTPATTAAPPAQPLNNESQILHPMPEDRSAHAKPLSALNESDGALRQDILGLIGGKSLLEALVFPDLVRRIVATVDNLPRERVAARLLPVKSVPGRFVPSGTPDSPALDSRNSGRYDAYVRLVEALDIRQAIALYVRFYPLFQQAYQELGYPKGYFNDRLITAIDDLLAAPQLHGPLRLAQPKVMYEFADPELESLSAGQKLLIRMGPANAERIKAKLRELRRELTRPGRTH